MKVSEALPMSKLVAARDAARDDLRRWRRLQGVVLAREGGTAAAIAKALGVVPETVRNWVKAFHARGLDLADRPRSGRPCRLDEEQQAALAARLDQPQAGDGNAWRSATLRPLVQREFGAAYSRSGLCALLRRLGYVRRMPRPRHPKSDPAAQARFKKSSAAGSPPNAGSVPAKSSSSGSPTRRGSARKGR